MSIPPRSYTKPKPSSQPSSPISPWPTSNITELYPRFSTAVFIWPVRRRRSSVTAPSSLRNLSSLRTTTSGRHGKISTCEGGTSVVPSKVFSNPGQRSEQTDSIRLGFGLPMSPVCYSHPRPTIRQLCFPVDWRCFPFAHLFTEWQIVDLATSLYGKALVPLYENFGVDSIGACHRQRICTSWTDQSERAFLQNTCMRS